MYENQRKTHDMSCWLTKKPEKTAIGCGQATGKRAQPRGRRASAACGGSSRAAQTMIEPGASSTAISVDGAMAQRKSAHACTDQTTSWQTRGRRGGSLSSWREKV